MDPLPASAPLHTMNPTGRFSDRVADYVRFRPSYPAAAIDALLDGLGEPSRLDVVDVGAGTGISARLIADRGPRVIAIEPNDAMREGAEPHERVSFRAGAAEATGLPAASADLVIAAQAFHWFREQEALAEFHRVLRAHRRLGLMWNIRDENDPFTAGYTSAIRDITGQIPAEMRAFDAVAITATGLFRDLRLAEFPYEQPLDEAALLGRASSASYVPKNGEAWDRLAAKLREHFRRFAGPGGLATMKYVTRVYTALGV